VLVVLNVAVSATVVYSAIFSRIKGTRKQKRYLWKSVGYAVALGISAWNAKKKR